MGGGSLFVKDGKQIILTYILMKVSRALISDINCNDQWCLEAQNLYFPLSKFRTLCMNDLNKIITYLSNQSSMYAVHLASILKQLSHFMSSYIL